MTTRNTLGDYQKQPGERSTGTDMVSSPLRHLRKEELCCILLKKLMTLRQAKRHLRQTKERAKKRAAILTNKIAASARDSEGGVKEY